MCPLRDVPFPHWKRRGCEESCKAGPEPVRAPASEGAHLHRGGPPPQREPTREHLSHLPSLSLSGLLCTEETIASLPTPEERFEVGTYKVLPRWEARLLSVSSHRQGRGGRS